MRFWRTLLQDAVSGRLWRRDFRFRNIGFLDICFGTCGVWILVHLIRQEDFDIFLIEHIGVEYLDLRSGDGMFGMKASKGSLSVGP